MSSEEELTEDFRFEKPKPLDKVAKLERFIKAIDDAGKYNDYCTQYQYDKIGDKEYFNMRFNNPNLKPFINIDRNEAFYRDFQRQAYIGSNDVFFIYGPKGMGKSEILMALMKYWVSVFELLKNKKVNKHGLINYVGFTDSQMISIFKIMEEGAIAGRDESPLTSGEGTATDTKNIQNIINQTRQMQTSFIFINPELIELSGVDYYIEVAGKDRTTKTTRCIWYDRRRRIMGFIYIKLHNDEEFRVAYNKKKKLNMKKLLYRGGGVWSIYNQEQFTQDCVKLYEFCLECDAKSLADVKTLLTNYNLQFDPDNEEEVINIIGGAKQYIEDVIRNVVFALTGNTKGLLKGLREHIEKRESEIKKPLSKEEQEKFLSEIQVEIEDDAKENEFSIFLSSYYYKILPQRLKINHKNSIKREAIIEILESWSYGTGIREIGLSVDVHQGIVNDILILFKKGKRGEVTISDDWRVYKMYEFWCAYKYNLRLISGHNRPDWNLETDWDILPGECKIYDDIKNSIRINKEKKLHSYKNYKDKYSYIPVLVRNVKWGNYDLLFKVPSNNDPYFSFVNDSQCIITKLDPKKFEDIYKKGGINYD